MLNNYIDSQRLSLKFLSEIEIRMPRVFCYLFFFSNINFDHFLIFEDSSSFGT